MKRCVSEDEIETLGVQKPQLEESGSPVVITLADYSVLKVALSHELQGLSLQRSHKWPLYGSISDLLNLIHERYEQNDGRPSSNELCCPNCQRCELSAASIDYPGNSRCSSIEPPYREQMLCPQTARVFETLERVNFQRVSAAVLLVRR